MPKLTLKTFTAMTPTRRTALSMTRAPTVHETEVPKAASSPSTRMGHPIKSRGNRKGYIIPP
jgi:hypothetical protein